MPRQREDAPDNQDLSPEGSDQKLEPPQVTDNSAAAEPRLTRKGSVTAPRHEFPLYYKVRSKITLRRAWRTVFENGATSKSENTRKQVKLFSIGAEQSLDRIARQLRQGKFRFPPSAGILQERPGKSPRPIVKSPIEGRIVQRALLDILQDQPGIKAYYENPTSFGGIKGTGLGVPGTIAYVSEIIRNGCSYYIRSDIEGFFTKIPRVVVLKKIHAVIDDDMFNELLERATATELDNLATLGEKADLFPLHEVGVAQGCCLSPLIGNILLEEFDKELNGRGIVCVRYIDDFLILGPRENKVVAAFKSAQRLLSKYGLNAYDPITNKEKAEIGEVKRGFQFLGCEIIPGLITPSAKARQRFMESLTSIVQKSKWVMESPREVARRKVTVARTLKELDDVAKGWGNQYSFCNNRDMRAVLDRQITELMQGYLRFVKQVMRRFGGKDNLSDWRRLIGVHLLIDSKYDPIIKSVAVT